MTITDFRAKLNKLKLNKEFKADEITSYHRQIIASTAKVLKRKYTTWTDGDVFFVHRLR